MTEKISGSQLIGRVLKEEGAECLFGVYGGELFGLMNTLGELGLKVYHMRSELGGGYAADAYARCLRRPGLCFSGGAPGFTNMVSPICEAYTGFSPVIGIVAQHAVAEDKVHGFQEAYANEIFKSMTKWTHLCADWHMHTYWIRKAFRDTMTFPPGPVVLCFPANTLMGRDEGDRQLKAASSQVPGKAQGDPRLVERVVEMLLNAERPLIIGGEGLYWSDAMDDLKELIELLQVPVHTRRISRGAVPEDHPLAISGGAREPIFRQADLILIIGLQASYLEDWFEPPVWNHETTKYIQIHETPEMLFVNPPTEIAIIGSPKFVLRQMVDCVINVTKEPPKRTEWLEFIKEVKECHDKAIREVAENYRHVKPITPEILCQEIVAFLDPTASIIYDSVTLAGAITDRLRAKFAGQIMEYPLHQPIGHGVGAAVGVQVARPGRQVIALVGDGGFGIGGWDVETLLRYNLPAVIIVYNNNAWAANPIPFIPKATFFGLTQGIRYDKMSEVIGCHGEHVEEVREIRPALHRAFNSGKPAIINVVGGHVPMPAGARRAGTFIARLGGWTIWSLANRSQLDEEYQAALRLTSPLMFKRILSSFHSFGLWVSEEELAEALGIPLDRLKEC
jgi:acetolactate synthase-1/2/3 large subunit